MVCDCYRFYFKLRNLSKYIFVKRDESLQWKVSEQFLTKYIGDDKHDTRLCISEDTSDRPCSIKICSLLLHNLAEFRRREVPLSTLLVDLIVILKFEYCARSCVHRVLDFERTPSSFSSDRETFRVLYALLNCDEDFMKLLLNFGLFSSLSSDSPRLLKKFKYDGFLYFMTGYVGRTEEAIKLVKGVFFHYEDGEYLKRMLLAIMMLDSIRLNLEGYTITSVSRFMSCFRMYFTGTRDALLSVYEVRVVLYVCLKVTNKLYLFDRFCEKIDKLMPECPAKMEPRKLTHLTRCQIRENLTVSTLPLPSAIDKLFLPKRLKNYLLGEVTDISEKRGNVTSQNSMTQSELELLLSGLSTS